MGERGTEINSGGRWLRANLGVAVRPADPITLSHGARLPFFADVNGRQLAETFTVSGAVTLAFGAGDEEDEHDDHGHDDHGHDDHGHDDHGHDDHGHDDHGHDDHGHDGSEGRVLDLAVGGESFDVESAVLDESITVIDFWATWCGPCVEVDHVLRELASEHEDLLVQRVEVVDSDSPVVRQHLDGSATLPQVWIFDRQRQGPRRLVGTDAADVRAAVQSALREASD